MELSIQKQNSEEYIYKFFRWDSLKAMLTDKRLRLEQTEKWEKDDVYENFAFKSLYNSKLPLRKSNIYGQSWTFYHSSDAMWQIYSDKPEKEQNISDLGRTAIKVRTTIPKLKEVISGPISDIECDKYAYMGSVKYMGLDKIKKWIKVSEKDKLIKSLFVKRWAYIHEKEYRIIVYIDNKETVEHIHFDIDTDYMFDKFFLDPRLTPNQCNEFTDYLIKTLNVSEDKIEKSSLQTLKGWITEGVELDWRRPNTQVTTINWNK